MTNFETHHNSGELLDVVDEFGRATGEVLPKKTIHAQGLRHHGETYLDGAVRGTSEELGLVRPLERFVQIGTFTSQLAIPG